MLETLKKKWAAKVSVAFFVIFTVIWIILSLLFPRILIKVINKNYNIKSCLFGLLSFNFALSTGPVSLVSAFTSSYVGIIAILAFLLLKENSIQNKFLLYSSC